MEIIISHINADFDSFASMIAAKKIYPRALLVFPGSQEKKLRDFLSTFPFDEIRRIKDIEIPKIKRLIIVDTKSPDRIAGFAELLSGAKAPEVHIYDHHPHAAGDIKGTIEIVEPVGATATIFTELLKSKRVPLTPMEATILCLGIYEETGSLLFPSTTERDVLAAAYLLKRGASLKIIGNFMRADFSREEFELLNELLQSGVDTEINGLRIKIAKAAREDYLGDAAHLAHRIMDMEDIDGLVLILSMQGKTVLVGRSRAPEFDVSEVMKGFEGGGHPTAASATIKDAPLEMVEEEVRERIKTAVKHGKRAQDVMATPVITISWDDRIRDAESMMTRYGVNVLPVIKDGKYRGIISREVVEKSIFHGFGKSVVSDFTTTDALTVVPQTQIREIERLMIEQNQRFMPVVEGDRIVGAITRTDILRTLYEDMLKRSRLKPLPKGEKPSIGRNFSSWLREKFPKHVSEMLRLAGEAADALGYNAYLVGGSVRDLLRGEENLDLDIVIEGDGISFAKYFSEKLSARVRTHERFGTAQIILQPSAISPQPLKIDIATARTEYYESPAALPKVETSSIKKDLYRRDFTINTLAVKLNAKDFGLLIDFFGGQRDLREKTIRVLHNLSFIEDPTRAFRAVRFSERFGFKLSKHTENLIKTALRMNLFDKLSGSRLYEELLMTFNETEPVRAIKRLSEYGLLKVIHPNLSFNEKMESKFQSTHDTLSWFNLLFLEEKPDRGMLYLTALLSELNDSERETAFARLSAPSKTKDAINKGILNAKDLIRALPLRDPAKIYRAMNALKIESLLFAMAIAGDDNKKKEISSYLLSLRQISASLGGNDLKRLGLLPGPLYSKVLSDVLDEKLRGRLKTKEDETEFVIKKYKVHAK